MPPLPADIQAVLDQARKVAIAFRGFEDDAGGCVSRHASLQVLLNWCRELGVKVQAYQDAQVERDVARTMAEVRGDLARIRAGHRRGGRR